MPRNFRSAALAAGAVLVIALGAFVLALPNDTENERSAPTTTTEPPTRYELRGFDSRAELDQAKDDYAFAVWLQRWEQGQFVAFTEAAWADYQAELAAQAARQSTSYSYGGVGDCSGFAIPDEIIQRESGGNPQAVNASSGAYGCAQVMPMHWEGGACDGMDRTNVDHQRECVDRLSSGGSNLQPWAATL